jgi:hypothetical protein
LAYKFRTLKPPFDAREVTIKREDNRILIEHEYDVTVTHPGLEPHVIHFHPRDEREIINPIKQ